MTKCENRRDGIAGFIRSTIKLRNKRRGKVLIFIHRLNGED